MSQRKKVIWYEGMNLDPHHFQQWDRYHKSTLDFRIRSITHYNWGLLEIAIDEDSLINGQFSLLRCKGVTPDGLEFNIPDEDPVPNSRNIQDLFPATESELNIFLAIPREKERGINCRLESESNKRETRFVFHNISVTDENTGADERQIGIGQTNFQLRMRNESVEDFSVLKIAKIVRSADGSFAIGEKFIPACLKIEASEAIMAITRRLVELLIAKSTALGSEKHFQEMVEYTTQDLTVFLAHQTLNTYIPQLNHIYNVAKVHPVELYQILLALAGQLTSFSPDLNISPSDFPNYDHNNLSKCFNELDEKIRMLLDRIVPSEYFISIPLEKKSESLYVGHVSDSNLFQKSKFFLIVSGDLPERRMIDEIPTNLRVASPDTIDAVLSSFRSALPLKHSSVPPAGLPAREGTQYFQLNPTGPFWEAICRSGAVAIFVPKELSGLKIEAIAV
jgi:type VI secretion system protein ImpJ